MFKIIIPENAERIMNILDCYGTYSFVVGGCVRDSILGKKPNDWDICTSVRPDRVLEAMSFNNIKTIETGLQHGTITAVVNDESYEITTFRTENEYSDNRRPDRVEFVGDIIEDLSRRDFTINAMAYNYYDGFIDPWGGCGDLLTGVIRCVRNPDDRFREDALRIMRALRFASTYGFKIEEKTAAAIHRNKHLLNNISTERIRDELCKILCGKGVLDILLNYSDVMAVIIPELESCIGFDQNNKFHIYTVYDHIAHAVSNYKGNDISIKMALLLHDIGKPECYSVDILDGVTGHFYGHSAPSARIAKDVMDRLKFDNKTKAEVVELVQYHDAVINPNTRSVKKWLNRIGRDILDKLFKVRIADIYAQSELDREGRISKCDKAYGIAQYVVCEQQCFQIKDLTVNGHDVLALGIDPGPRVGEVLGWLLAQVLDEEITNDHDILIEEAKRYLEATQ